MGPQALAGVGVRLLERRAAGRLAGQRARVDAVAAVRRAVQLDVAEIGSDLTFLPGAVAGLTLLIGEMTMSGA